MRGRTVRLCSICKEDYAVLQAQTVAGKDICVCDRCLEVKARRNFVWICLGCRRVYLRQKRMVIARTDDEEMRGAYLELLDATVIQGMESCVACDRERILQEAGAC